MPDILRSVLWQFVDRPGTETCTLWQTRRGFVLGGAVVTALEGQPLLARYRVVCDRDWRTLSVKVAIPMQATRRNLHLRVDQEHRWWAQSKEHTQLQGCLDVDLGITPATNTLPVKRLGLLVGQSAEIRIAWVRFPDLVVRPMIQRYTRLGEYRYRYENLESGYSTEIEVDELGLVVQYAGVWQRAAHLTG